eukprot:gnl/MRDRNA2_/MRDRNA2_107629_c0_seq1.p1 gnl/MRDRNA2_/MRDRNA2_107629_c0~~gnl/MRDRNA2_/MRDRNA2_107629_c0_seq1.p1  ORF type:complete len:742 (+),score=159.66 gnl/MRDRNA2_/MRDRNA2_107629_c0_seq1:68-2293(+)
MEVEQALQAFVEKWQLDSKAIDSLSVLSPEQLVVVIQGFDPGAGTRNVNAKLAGFIKSKVSGAGKGSATQSHATPVDEEALAAFIGQWQLDEKSVATLLSLSPENKQRAITSFAPSDTTANINAKFMGWVRSLGSGSGGNSVSSFAGGGRAQASFDDGLLIDAFVEQWGVDQSCKEMLINLSPEIRTGVITDFSPGADTTNVNAKLMTFAKKRAQMMGGGTNRGNGGMQSFFDDGSMVEAFVVNWGLDESCRTLLHSLPPDVKMSTINEFNPGSDTTNVNAKLMTFAKRKVQLMGRSGSMGTGSAAHAGQQMVTTFHGRGYGSQGGGNEMQLSAFVNQWGLDQGSQAALRGASADVQQYVMAQFAPNGSTRNVNAVFMTFMKGAMRDMQGSGGGMAGMGGMGGHMGGMSGQMPGGGHNVTGDLEADLTNFIYHWGLDEGALELMMSLPDDKIVGVMQAFNPPPGTQNVNAMLHSFVKGRLSKGEKGGGKGASLGGTSSDMRIQQFAMQWGLDEKSQQMLSGMSEQQLDAVFQNFAPSRDTVNVDAKLRSFVKANFESNPLGAAQMQAGGTKRTYNTAFQATQGGVQPHDVEIFCQTWGVDEGCRAKLMSLDEETLRGVLTDFAPGGATQNVNAKLTSFIKNRSAGKGPGKGHGSEAPGMYGGGYAGGMWPSQNPIDEFVSKWGLDEKSRAALQGLDEGTLLRVFQGFDPAPSTRNKDAKLAMWLKSIPAADGAGFKRQRMS